MTHQRCKALPQDGRYASPWPTSVRLRTFLWRVVWCVLFRTTPKPLNGWRLLLLRLFGARISGRPFVAAGSFVTMPWQFEMHDRACLAPGAEVYNLGPVRLEHDCTIAQQVYLCGGTHDVDDPNLPLVVGEIIVGPHVFIGARAFVMPGVHIAEGAVIGACSVVTRDVPEYAVCAGNPCRVLRGRRRLDAAPPTEAPDA